MNLVNADRTAFGLLLECSKLLVASHVDLGDIRWGPGIGFQYWTPAGPLRAEYAWKINAEPGESGGQFFISFGVPF